MNRDERFEMVHPLTSMVFFLIVLLCAMTIVHPYMVVAAAVVYTVYYFLIKGAKGIKLILGLMAFVPFVALFNAFVNPRGDTVLFYILGRRPFTLEALVFGFVNGGVFYIVIVAFAIFNEVMSTDKVSWLLGRKLPAVALLFSMIIRLIPLTGKRLLKIHTIGRGIRKDEKNTIKRSLNEISALTNWALEESVTMADSMKCRGYGSKKMNKLSIYHFGKLNAIELMIMTGLSLGMLILSEKDAAYAYFLPSVVITKGMNTDIFLWLYLMFMILPAVSFAINRRF